MEMTSEQKAAYISARVEMLKLEKKSLKHELSRDVYGWDDIEEAWDSFNERWEKELGEEALRAFFGQSKEGGEGINLVPALESLLTFAENNTCLHEETYRGGAIWEICRQCDMKWADDRGGKPEDAHEFPEPIKRAQEALHALRPPADQSKAMGAAPDLDACIDDLKRLHGLGPHGSGDPCCGDGYFGKSIRAKYSAKTIEEAEAEIAGGEKA